MQRSFVQVSYTQMLKSFIKAQANCFCIRQTGPSIYPRSVRSREGSTRLGTASPQKVAKLETNRRLRLHGHAAVPPRPWPEPEPSLAPRTWRAPWMVGAAASPLPRHSLCTRHSSGWIFCCIGFPHIYPDITWAGALPASAQHEFAVQKKKLLLENDVFCGRKTLKCSEEEFYEFCFNTHCATPLLDFIIYDFI